MKAKDGSPIDEEISVVSTTGMRHSKRATPLAPRLADDAELELVGLQRASDMSGISGTPLVVQGRPGVLGHVWCDAAGTVTSSGEACDGPFPDRVHYFTELARRVGAELGFEVLGEMHVASDKHRIVWTARPDGGWAAALTTTAERPVELARLMRGDR